MAPSSGAYPFGPSGDHGLDEFVPLPGNLPFLAPRLEMRMGGFLRRAALPLDLRRRHAGGGDHRRQAGEGALRVRLQEHRPDMAPEGPRDVERDRELRVEFNSLEDGKQEISHRHLITLLRIFMERCRAAMADGADHTVPH